jgi:uncharacterized protein YqeY
MAWPATFAVCVPGRAARLISLSITERIQADATAAAKAKDRERLGTLRLLLDALNKEAKEARGTLDEQREFAVLKRERKRRAEAAEAYRKGGREELATSEEAEATVIEEYLPAEISDDELESLVADALSETGAASQKEMGKVMAAVMSKAGGRADGRRVSDLVRSKLS